MAEYESLSLDTPKSIAWVSTGGDGSGKSHFGLTGPSPIFVYAFDPYGMNRVNKEAKITVDGVKKDIRIARYPFNMREAGDDKDKVKSAAKKIWEAFRTDYDFALGQGFKTLIIDREDMMYDMQRFKEWGIHNNAPKEYGPLYSETLWLVQKAQGYGVNLGFLRGIRDEWVSKFDPQKAKMVAHNTGKKIADGMSKMADYVDVSLEHRWDPALKAFVVKIDKFTNADEKGMEYPNLTFTDMATLAYPETSPEDWE